MGLRHLIFGERSNPHGAQGPFRFGSGLHAFSPATRRPDALTAATVLQA